MPELQEYIDRLNTIGKYQPVTGKLNEGIENNLVSDELKDLERKNVFRNAFTTIMKTLPRDLEAAAKNIGDRDGELEVKPNVQTEDINLGINRGQIDEAAYSLIGGAVLAIPQLSKLIAQGLNNIGYKIDSRNIQGIAKVAADFGKESHHLYIKGITSIINHLDIAHGARLKPEMVANIANGVFTSIIVVMLIGAMKESINANDIAVAGAEFAIGAVKSVEIKDRILQAVEAGLEHVTAGGITKGARKMLNSMYQNFIK